MTSKLATFLVFLLLTVITACKEEEDDIAKYVIPEQVSMGIVNAGDSLYKNISVVNNGSQNLLIKQIITSCHCTTTSFTKLISPNDTGIITIKFRASLVGNIDQMVVVETNSKPALKKIKISGYVK